MNKQVWCFKALDTGQIGLFMTRKQAIDSVKFSYHNVDTTITTDIKGNIFDSVKQIGTIGPITIHDEIVHL